LIQKVTYKKIEKSYEAGSGALTVPILAGLFPKLFRQEMNESLKYYIYTEKYRYEVRKEDYDKLNIGDVFDESLSIYA
jgi:hypothetical protein